jgi:hypothetical protein
MRHSLNFLGFRGQSFYERNREEAYMLSFESRVVVMSESMFYVVRVVFADKEMPGVWLGSVIIERVNRPRTNHTCT